MNVPRRNRVDDFIIAEDEFNGVIGLKARIILIALAIVSILSCGIVAIV